MHYINKIKEKETFCSCLVLQCMLLAGNSTTITPGSNCLSEVRRLEDWSLILLLLFTSSRSMNNIGAQASKKEKKQRNSTEGILLVLCPVCCRI